ncbi:hypothetical protein SAMN05443429_11147 [Cruoricaptor ignavus]|uniref:DUF6759 domain-containing protein n=1 Tax=Cruoricaptor ignavus TaxID=1118202 RepID=A0A1M6H6P4_9FLAO|nr:DUF6759 domain-containing protein [Cruoricaptor ignavus]SHJ17852.1 hypothetical protein SAMN05443429_11147 [Cruoricaptor ignavus]
MKKFIIYSAAFCTLSSCFKKEIAETDSVIADTAFVEVDSAQVPLEVTDPITVNLPPNLMDYETAQRLNTSDGWKKFLADNPNYENKKEIEERIIRAEVDEIIRSGDTGEIPQSEALRGGDQEVSTMIVENNTSCELTLLYSGTDALRISIAPNSKQKFSMRSGNYRVAAQACGYNYAGAENLAGDYSVVYYITTTRY